MPTEIWDPHMNSEYLRENPNCRRETTPIRCDYFNKTVDPVTLVIKFFSSRTHPHVKQIIVGHYMSIRVSHYSRVNWIPRHSLSLSDTPFHSTYLEKGPVQSGSLAFSYLAKVCSTDYIVTVLNWAIVFSFSIPPRVYSSDNDPEY